MANSIDNRDDIIDSRDVIARIEELEEEREALADALEHANEEADDTQEGAAAVETATAALNDWDNNSDEAEELKQLRALATEAEGYSDDWRYGATLIRDSYFKEYTIDLARDLHGKAIDNAEWPFSCIDWEKAADQLKQDYTALDFNGVEYWVR